MRRYVQISGAFFCGLLAVVQLTRTVLRWSVQVDGVVIPVWASGLAFLIALPFAVWAFRSAQRAA